jgi:SIR2-like protein
VNVQQPLEPGHWEVLLDRIRDQRCTPFLGAGAAAELLPLGGELARRWANAEDYPLEDSGDLARVAQFIAVKFDPMTPKERIARLIREAGDPNFDDPAEPHMALARLPLPIFLTTNFDDYMVRALRQCGKEPRQELCRWNERLLRRITVFDSADGWTPTVEEPLVYHLHGHCGVPESLVLTEDDYFDFLVNIPQLGIPPVIQEALSATSLMFVGYRLADWNFRVLFRGFVELTQPSDRRLSVTVQLPPAPNEARREQAMQYLRRYFDKKEMVVYWGEARNFMDDLRRHWADADGD